MAKRKGGPKPKKKSGNSNKKVIKGSATLNRSNGVEVASVSSHSEIDLDKELVVSDEELDDIVDELMYWEHAVVVYVVGSNPPVSVMENFLNRIWGKYGVHQVSLMKRGLFLVRLKDKEAQDNVMNLGGTIFNSKPLIVQRWNEDEDYSTMDIQKVPVWVRLPGLDFQYWGEKSMGKIAGIVGSLIKTDQATMNRDRLMYARVMLEMDITKEWPKEIHFLNEKGVLVTQPVEYEWKPVYCEACKGYGHDKEKCRRKMKQVWVPKPKEVASKEPVVIEKKGKEPVVDEDGFQPVTKPCKPIVRSQGQPSTAVSNGFHILQHEKTTDEVQEKT